MSSTEEQVQEGSSVGVTRRNEDNRRENLEKRHSTSPASLACQGEAALSEHCLDFLEAQKQAELTDLLDKLGILHTSATSVSSADVRQGDGAEFEVFSSLTSGSREVGGFHQNEAEGVNQADTAKEKPWGRTNNSMTPYALRTSSTEEISDVSVSPVFAGEQDESRVSSVLPTSGSPLPEKNMQMPSNEEILQEDDSHYPGCVCDFSRPMIDATAAEVVSDGFLSRIKAVVYGIVEGSAVSTNPISSSFLHREEADSSKWAKSKGMEGAFVKEYRGGMSPAVGDEEQSSMLPQKIMNSRDGTRLTLLRRDRKNVRSKISPSVRGVSFPATYFQHRGRTRKIRQNVLADSLFFPCGMSFSQLRIESCESAFSYEVEESQIPKL
uniref:Uncharacterized protein n=1 Tax=Toxoplasma gondii COUG TaxID=1074873 RepID=A0A2G8Y7H6_TOXGO|nr:hypothetical protein TGCOUG_231950 [Toxoplasma gondii COUG]